MSIPVKLASVRFILNDQFQWVLVLRPVLQDFEDCASFFDVDLPLLLPLLY